MAADPKISALKAHRSRLIRQALRNRIKGEEHLDHIIRILTRMEQHAGLEAAAGPALSPDPYVLGALKAAMDGHFKILNKILPDLKAEEMSEGDAGAGGRIMSDTELIHRLQHLGENVAAKLLPHADDDTDLF
jgi:hypothetical protein